MNKFMTQNLRKVTLELINYKMLQLAEKKTGRLVMSKVLQHLVTACRISRPRSLPLPLVTRLSAINVSPAAHNALTSSKLCSRLSQVWCIDIDILS